MSEEANNSHDHQMQDLMTPRRSLLRRSGHLIRSKITVPVLTLLTLIILGITGLTKDLLFDRDFTEKLIEALQTRVLTGIGAPRGNGDNSNVTGCTL